jgi:hypothetical protein
MMEAEADAASRSAEEGKAAPTRVVVEVEAAVGDTSPTVVPESSCPSSAVTSNPWTSLPSYAMPPNH